MSLTRLAAVDAAGLGTGLSPAGARAAWAAAIEGAASADASRPLPGRAPHTVAIIASANVFTAPLEWAWALSQRGVRVILKSARGLAPVGETLATYLPGVEHHPWRGGDVEAEAAALRACDAALVFGSAETIATVRARAPVPVLGFGPRFGVAHVPTFTPALARAVGLDHALYDARGCMSPTAVATDDTSAAGQLVAAAMTELAETLPRGEVSAAEAVQLRALTMLARATGQLWTGPDWIVVALPLAHARAYALPRAVVLHAATLGDLGAALGDFSGQLGTIALPGAPESDLRGHPGLIAALGLHGLPPARVCAVGEMQRPPGNRALHDGIDVLGALWSLPAR